MVGRPIIDVLLATFQANARFLREQVESIRAQRGVEVRLIVREDEAHEGATANFSALLEKSGGDYCAFADQDDVWKDDKLEKMMAVMSRLEQSHGKDVPLLVFCDSTVVDESLHVVEESFVACQRVNVASALRFPRLLMQNFIAGHAMLFNAALRRKAGGVPKSALMHDNWFALTASAFGHISYLDERLVLYRQHGANSLGAVVPSSGAMEFRRRLAANVAQARAFSDRFGHEAPSAARILAGFADMGWFARRWSIVRHGLWKQGLKRNLALLVLS